MGDPKALEAALALWRGEPLEPIKTDWDARERQRFKHPGIAEFDLSGIGVENTADLT